ncbi:MAG: undecaprenyl-phosphate glucose phosphotransferase [Beijerinckiaceae bacterium]|nr:undecaprenyl-phosphate glucose phosphotransferase [Beijerinckiaceae bacterium]MCZ8301234.1 undecaprenyl-phosphate glucose phosphotransferase [Beijerinckiaceae bacterium]
MSLDLTERERPGATLSDRMAGWIRRASKQKIIGLVLIFDIMTLVGCGLWSAMAFLPASFGGDGTAFLLVASVTGLTVYFLQRLWAYTLPALAMLPRQIKSVIYALGGAFVVMTGLLFLIGFDIMALRLWLLGWLLFSLILLVFFRLLASVAISDAEARGDLARRAVIVGGGKPAEDLIRRLSRSGNRAIRILGVFDDRGGERSPDAVDVYRKIGTFDELEAYCREQVVDLLIIALPASAEERILHLVRKLWQLPIDVRIAAHASRLKLSKRAYSYIGDVPFLAVFDRPLSDWNSALKAVFDRVVAALALVVLSPLMLAVALAVKLESKGPVLFRQQRFGFNNNIIGVLKFRSMYTDRTDAHGARQVTRDDPRVTRVGRFIRKTSIDELPQLINVLRGELSLVGPRPHATQSKAANQLYQDVVDGYYARHRMKPGITGWAQINGWRGETDTLEKIERRVEHDLYYIENWSLPLDLYILAMTPLSLFNTKNAY